MKPTPFFRLSRARKVSAWQPTVIVLPADRIQKRMLLTGVLLFYVFFSSFSQERNFLLTVHDSCHVRAPREAIAPFAVAAAGASLVRIAYIIPSNRTPQPNAAVYLQHAVKTGQQWYREQMEQNGFGAKTFLFETEADGVTPLVHIVPVTETDDYLRGDIWGRTLQAATNAGLSVWAAGEVWILMPETHLMAPDGVITGGVALGASNGTGNSPGVTMIGSNALPLFKPEMITDDTPYDGKMLAALGPYPLKQDLSFAWFEGTTFSSVTSSYIGALLHEMGHAFGLAHDFRNDNNFHGNLMGNGLRGMRGSLFPGKYPQDVTRLEYGAGLILSVSHYFNRDKTVTSSPVLNYNNPGPVIPQQGLVRLPFEASDPDSLSLAQLRYDGNLVAEMVLRGTRTTATFAVPYFTKGNTNSYTLALHDRQGNATYTGVQFAVPTGYNQAPVPFIRINPAIPGGSPLITLDASQSQDVDHSISSVTAAWDVNNDGQFDIESGTNKTAQYGYATPGNYLIRLKLKDPDGGESISTPVSVRITTAGTPPGGNGTGLRAEYFNNISLTGAPVVNRVDPLVDFTWNAASPATGVNADNFSARWTGQIEAPVTGNFIFSTVSDDGVRVWINGVQVINNWTDHAPTINNSVAIPLTAGTKYDIRMEFYDHTLGAVARLLWSYPGQAQQPVPQGRLYPAGVGTPGNGTGLLGQYFNNINLTGIPLVTRVDQQIDFTWNAASPAPEINADNFSARWVGQVEAPVTGNYVFSTVSDDGIRLWINDVQVINNWTDHAPVTNNSVAIPLTGGTKYSIRMEFYDHTLGAVARLLWAYSGQAQQPLPQSRLYPATPGAGGSGTGLKAEYFNNVTFSGVPAVSRVDPQVDFTWNAAPATGVNADNFSVRWIGQVEAPVTGNFVFSTVSDDGVRLWVNGTQVINNWTDHAPTVNNSAAIALTAGAKYDISMEFYDHTLGAVARLLWAYPGQAQQPIPQTRLYPEGGSCYSCQCSQISVALSSQAEVDAFKCTEFTGILIISGADITNLRSLSLLKSVGSISISNNPRLANLQGLNALELVTGSGTTGVSIYGNAILTDIDALASLRTIGRSAFIAIDIANNPMLKNINGLISIRTLNAGLSITGNASLENIDGLKNLTEVGLDEFLNNGSLTISDNASLRNIDGLSSLKSLYGGRNGGLFIQNNPLLTNVDGLSSLTAIDAQIAGGLFIENNARLNNLNGLRSVTSITWGPAGRISIQNNPSLENVDGLSSIKTLGVIPAFTMAVVNNPVLRRCCGLFSIFSLIGSEILGTLVTMSGNGTGCTVEDVIAGGICTGNNGTGLRGEYFNNVNLTGTPFATRVDPQVDFTWNASSPATGINADNFSVRWTGQVEAPVTGNFVFSTVSDDGVRLWINGVQVINNWTDHAPTVNNSVAIPLTAGAKYDIRMEFYEHTLGAVARLLWAYPGQAQQPIPQSRLYPAGTPGSGTGLSAAYYNNISLTGVPVLTRVDPQVDFTWDAASPAMGINADNFSVRWMGQVEAPITGNYVFSTLSDDGVRLWINGMQVINNWTDHAPTVNNSVTIPLTGGTRYDIRMEFYEHTLGAVARLLWAYPGQVQQPVPQSRLYAAATSSLARISLAEHSTEITSTQEDTDVLVYPNPAKDVLNVVIHSNIRSEVGILIQSPVTQEGAALSANLVEGENYFEIPVHNLKNGLYILTINQAGQKIARKIMIVK